MASPALSPPDRHALAAIIVACERCAAQREAELACLTQQVREVEADLKQLQLLLAYLRTKAAES